MAKYDGLIIPRSYNDYINKSDPLGVSQALQLNGVMDDTPTPGSSKPVKSNGLVGLSAVDVVETGNMHPVTSNAVAETAADLEPVDEVTLNNMHSVTSNAVANAMSYSTSEVNTGKKWIDGKPIYRKVVQKNIAITNGVDIDLSDIAIDTPISLDYVLQDGAGGSIHAYNNTNITFNFYKSGSTNNARILINTIGGWNLRQTTQNFIIEYTKTID